MGAAAPTRRLNRPTLGPALAGQGYGIGPDRPCGGPGFLGNGVGEYGWMKRNFRKRDEILARKSAVPYLCVPLRYEVPL